MHINDYILYTLRTGIKFGIDDDDVDPQKMPDEKEEDIEEEEDDLDE